MMLNLQQDPAAGGVPESPPATPAAAPSVQPVAPTPSTTPQQPTAAPALAPTSPVEQAPAAAEPPIPADTPMIYAGTDGVDRQSTVAELIDAKNTLEELGDLERIKNLKKVLDGDPAAMQGLLQGELSKLQKTQAPAQQQTGAPLDPETSQRLERLEQDVAHSRRYTAQAEQDERLTWIKQALQTPGISQHIPLAAAHPQAAQRIAENLNTAKVMLASQGIDPNTPQGQQSMQQALFNSFNRLEKQLAADQAHFSGNATPANPQVQAAQVPGQTVPNNGSVVPQPSGGAAPLMEQSQPGANQTSKSGMRDLLRSQRDQMGMT